MKIKQFSESEEYTNYANCLKASKLAALRERCNRIQSLMLPSISAYRYCYCGRLQSVYEEKFPSMNRIYGNVTLTNNELKTNDLRELNDNVVYVTKRNFTLNRCLQLRDPTLSAPATQDTNRLYTPTQECSPSLQLQELYSPDKSQSGVVSFNGYTITIPHSLLAVCDSVFSDERSSTLVRSFVFYWIFCLNNVLSRREPFGRSIAYDYNYNKLTFLESREIKFGMESVLFRFFDITDYERLRRAVANQVRMNSNVQDFTPEEIIKFLNEQKSISVAVQVSRDVLFDFVRSLQPFFVGLNRFHDILKVLCHQSGLKINHRPNEIPPIRGLCIRLENENIVLIFLSPKLMKVVDIYRLASIRRSCYINEVSSAIFRAFRQVLLFESKVHSVTVLSGGGLNYECSSIDEDSSEQGNYILGEKSVDNNEHKPSFEEENSCSEEETEDPCMDDVRPGYGRENLRFERVAEEESLFQVQLEVNRVRDNTQTYNTPPILSVEESRSTAEVEQRTEFDMWRSVDFSRFVNKGSHSDTNLSNIGTSSNPSTSWAPFTQWGSVNVQTQNHVDAPENRQNEHQQSGEPASYSLWTSNFQISLSRSNNQNEYEGVPNHFSVWKCVTPSEEVSFITSAACRGKVQSNSILDTCVPNEEAKPNDAETNEMSEESCEEERMCQELGLPSNQFFKPINPAFRLPLDPPPTITRTESGRFRVSGRQNEYMAFHHHSDGENEDDFQPKFELRKIDVGTETEDILDESAIQELPDVYNEGPVQHFVPRAASNQKEWSHIYNGVVMKLSTPQGPADSVFAVSQELSNEANNSPENLMILKEAINVVRERYNYGTNFDQRMPNIPFLDFQYIHPSSSSKLIA